MTNVYKSSKDRWLIIPDLQIPFEHPDALKFCYAIKKEFKIPDENVLNVGDEVDQYFGSAYLKDPDALHTPMTEIAETRDRVRAWGAKFPQMKLAVSNHGIRWAKRAFDAQMPQTMIRKYQDVIDAPPGWKWKYKWIIKAKHPFCMLHGMGYSGASGHRNAAIDAGMSCVIGHLHSHAGIANIHTNTMKIWGMNAGALIDHDAYAFSYSKHSRHLSCNGVGVVLNEGSTPIWIPLQKT